MGARSPSHAQRLHRSTALPRNHRAVVAGFPVTSVARTCFDPIGDPDPGLRRSVVGQEIHAKHMARAVNDALARRGMTMAQFASVRAPIGGRGRSGALWHDACCSSSDPDYVPTQSEGESLAMEIIDALGLRARTTGADERPSRLDHERGLLVARRRPRARGRQHVARRTARPEDGPGAATAAGDGRLGSVALALQAPRAQHAQLRTTVARARNPPRTRGC